MTESFSFSRRCACIRNNIRRRRPLPILLAMLFMIVAWNSSVVYVVNWYLPAMVHVDTMQMTFPLHRVVMALHMGGMHDQNVAIVVGSDVRFVEDFGSINVQVVGGVALLSAYLRRAMIVARVTAIDTLVLTRRNEEIKWCFENVERVLNATRNGTLVDFRGAARDGVVQKYEDGECDVTSGGPTEVSSRSAKVAWCDHEWAHAMSALLTSPFAQALVLTVAGGGNDGRFVLWHLKRGVDAHGAAALEWHALDKQDMVPAWSFQYVGKILIDAKTAGEVAELARQGTPRLEWVAALVRYLTMPTISTVRSAVDADNAREMWAIPANATSLPEQLRRDVAATIQVAFNGIVLHQVRRFLHSYAVEHDSLRVRVRMQNPTAHQKGDGGRFSYHPLLPALRDDRTFVTDTCVQLCRDVLAGVQATDALELPEGVGMALAGGGAYSTLLLHALSKHFVSVPFSVPPWPGDAGLSLGCALAQAYRPMPLQTVDATSSLARPLIVTAWSAAPHRCIGRKRIVGRRPRRADDCTQA
jgi:hypothetical protein